MKEKIQTVINENETGLFHNLGCRRQGTVLIELEREYVYIPGSLFIAGLEVLITKKLITCSECKARKEVKKYE